MTNGFGIAEHFLISHRLEFIIGVILLNSSSYWLIIIRLWCKYSWLDGDVAVSQRTLITFYLFMHLYIVLMKRMFHSVDLRSRDNCRRIMFYVNLNFQYNFWWISVSECFYICVESLLHQESYGYVIIDVVKTCFTSTRSALSHKFLFRAESSGKRRTFPRHCCWRAVFAKLPAIMLYTRHAILKGNLLYHADDLIHLFVVRTYVVILQITARSILRPRMQLCTVI